MMRSTFCIRLAGLAVFVWLAGVAPMTVGMARAETVKVFAAASLKNALDAVTAEWQKQTGKAAVISYGASSAIAKQIGQGAPADLFISADLDWMNDKDKVVMNVDGHDNPDRATGVGPFYGSSHKSAIRCRRPRDAQDESIVLHHFQRRPRAERNSRCVIAAR